MKKYYLVTFDFNWADEADFSGFAIYTEEQWKVIEELRNKIKDDKRITLCFGTNEDQEYSGKDFKEFFEPIEITEEEAQVFFKYFGKSKLYSNSNKDIKEYEKRFGKEYYSFGHEWTGELFDEDMYE